MRMLKTLTTLLTGAAMIGALAVSTNALARDKGRGNDDVAPVVYVISQGLFYDSIVLATLPAKGSFQQLFMSGPSGLETDLGPGEVGYLGGRWWVDGNDNGVMDVDPEDPDYEEGDAFFLCPLLGPGKEDLED